MISCVFAASVVCAHADILLMPGGLETNVGRRIFKRQQWRQQQ